MMCSLPTNTAIVLSFNDITFLLNVASVIYSISVFQSLSLISVSNSDAQICLMIPAALTYFQITSSSSTLLLSSNSLTQTEGKSQ